ncbi:unnamed protein product [Amoebophrya sp. A120]|nr:unnamed protein product [Amoebophrya sp. A120]|eukprot:GSA120T00003557001.1
MSLSTCVLGFRFLISRLCLVRPCLPVLGVFLSCVFQIGDLHNMNVYLLSKQTSLRASFPIPSATIRLSSNKRGLDGHRLPAPQQGPLLMLNRVPRSRRVTFPGLPRTRAQRSSFPVSGRV